MVGQYYWKENSMVVTLRDKRLTVVCKMKGNEDL